MIGRFLNCAERFRIHTVEGLQPVRKFSHRVEYGNMFHVCEENHAAGNPWHIHLEDYCTNLCDQYPMHRQDIAKWYYVCLTQFPLYLGYWKAHPEQVSRKSLLQEQVFDVPYRLPSGRTVRLRGKWDGVSLMDGGIYLDEHKTKGDVDCQQIARNLTFDLQTMTYLVAMKTAHNSKEVYTWFGRDFAMNDIKGVRYNVVRRPLSGGKGTIVQKQGTGGSKCPKCKGNGVVGTAMLNEVCPKCGGKGKVGGTEPETDAEYYSRLGAYIRDEPGSYFFRWTTETTAQDIERFEAKFLRPFLEYLCEWYDHVTDPVTNAKCEGVYGASGGRDSYVHWVRPFGVENYLDAAGFSDYDAYIMSGSQVGLRKVTTLFTELGV